MTKVLTVVGARPQFVKAAAVSRAIRDRDDIEEVLLHTGQHYDANMSDVFFEELGIPAPEINLGIGSASHGVQTGRMLADIEHVLLETTPTVVLVYGDTNSTLAGALAAAKLDVPVAHVEAGLRSFNRKMPEEVNRVVTDHLSTVLFAPTSNAVRNLQTEGVADDAIVATGDVMYDVALYAREQSARRKDVHQRFGLEHGGFALATVHRAENTDSVERLSAIVDALCELATELPVVLPLHPRTRDKLGSRNFARLSAAVGMCVIDPVGYLDMTLLESTARVVLTDSGGVQKEAYFHGVPCVTLRYETEWSELVEAGWNRLAQPDSAQAILRATREALCSRPGAQQMLYGDGTAAVRIVDELQLRFSAIAKK